MTTYRHPFQANCTKSPNGSQDLHSPAASTRTWFHRVQDRPRPEAQGGMFDRRRRAGHGRGFRAGPQPGQSRDARPGHRRAVLHRRPCPGGQPPGRRGQGFVLLVRNLPQERLSIAAAAVATAGRCSPGRSTTPGRTVSANRSAPSRTAASSWPRWRPGDDRRTFVDRCVELLNDGRLTAEEASMAKWWTTRAAEAGGRHRHATARRLRLHERVSDRVRAWTDARITSILAGPPRSW